MKTFVYKTNTPAGNLKIISDGGCVTALEFSGGEEAPEEPDDVIRLCVLELDKYFAGELTRFTVPVRPSGTPFQTRVWNELTRIPYGQTISYKELAERIGNPRAVRAVGGANHRNPVSIIIPCHRVIGSNGSLTGFGGGLPAKEFLLDLESGGLSRSRFRKHPIFL